MLGQIMLAQRMGKTRIIAETGAGMHGVATATLCAKFGLPCVVYMGAVDVERQQPNVLRMKMLGAEVRAVESGSKTLKDAMNEALRDWVTNVADTFYCIGTVAGPHPYPMMVRDFQSIIGNETREQMQEAEGRLPDSLIACIGGGSNAMGLFHPFLDDRQIEIYGVEAAGHGIPTGQHAASIAGGRPGVLHGNRTYLLMDGDGQINEAHSISAGLDYPGHRPGARLARRSGPRQIPVRDRRGGAGGVPALRRLEGIIPALEPCHALAKIAEIAPKKPQGSPDGAQPVRPRRQGPRQRRPSPRRPFLMWAPFAWWNGLGRQKRSGWLIIAVSVFYIVYFLKGRLFAPGLPIQTKEWVWFTLSFAGIVLGTINIRMAEMRERNQQTMPLVHPDQIRKK